MMRHRIAAAAASFALATAGPLARDAQQQPAPPPRFTSGVELLRIDVTAIDGSGRPVRDLAPADFKVEVDGRERSVLFARFSGPGAAPDARAATPLPSCAINTSSGGGRAIVFVVDLGSIKAGYEKMLLDTAARLVDGLGPNDAVGLMPIPGRSIDLTRDRARVAAALRTLRGTTNVPFIRHYFTIAEAVDWENRESRVMREVIERECPEWDRGCPSELRDEVRELLQFARMHVQTVLGSIAGLARAMQPIEAPKTIVLISAGLPFEQESLTWFTDARLALARAGIMVYAVQVAQPDNDASNLRRPGVGLYRSADVQTGLANVATMAGGAMFAGVGTAGGVFERLRAEIVHSYVLGVQGAPGDADGRTHAIRVTVRRPGVTVRSRRELLVPEAAPDPARKLAALMSQPVDVTELPIAAAAYTVRGEEGATVKVIVAAELARDVETSPPLRYALALLREGKAAFETNDVAAIDGRTPPAARVVTAAQVAPGQYRLRLAAVDAAGRGGTVELPVSVGLRAAADLQLSDLIVGAVGEAFTPLIHARRQDRLAALLELYAADPARFADATVRIDVRRAGSDAVVATSEAALRATGLERRQVAEATIETSALEPGEYFLSAVVSLAGHPVGRVSRAIVIEAL